MSKPLLKPPWLLYAAEVRQQLDNLPARKSQKPYENLILWSWKTAVREKGCEGSEADWNYLLHSLGRKSGV